MKALLQKQNAVNGLSQALGNALNLKTSDNNGRRPNGMAAIFKKEMSDHIHSKRFLIVLVLILATSLASLYGAVTGMNASKDQMEFAFLKLYTMSGSSIPSFISFIALLGPFVGLTLGFDAINNERSGGTLNRLVSQPVYRDAVINGKFLAGAAVITVMVCSMGIAVGAAGMIATGVVPTGGELARVAVFLIFTIVYICFWLALSILFSVVCRHAATSALCVIAIWLFFALFMGILASILTTVLFPVDNMSSMAEVMQSYSFQSGFNRISPYYLYGEAVSTMMDPGVRTVSVISMAQLDGAIAGYLPLAQSLLLIWPHLIGLLAMTGGAFVISYISFMRQEIRAS